MATPLTNEDINALRKKNYNATLERLIQVHSDLRIFRIRPDLSFPPHKAGQYTTLALGNWEPCLEDCAPDILRPGEEMRLVRRAYSLSHPILDPAGNLSTDDPNQLIEFYVALIRTLEQPGSTSLTPRLFLLREGDRLFLGEKVVGHYTLDPVHGDEDVILLATGTGKAPHNYKVWELLRRGHQGASSRCAAPLPARPGLPLRSRTTHAPLSQLSAHTPDDART